MTMRSTHYHIEQHGRRSVPIKYQAHARLQALRLAGVNGTPSGFLPVVVPCYSTACLDPPLLSQAVAAGSPRR